LKPTNARPAQPSNPLAEARANCRGQITAVLIFSVFVNLLMLTGPLFMLQIYDRVLGSRAEETLVALFGLVAVLFLFYGLLDFARGRVMARVGARIQSQLDDQAFQAVLARSALVRGQPKGNNAISDVDSINALFTSPMLLALFDMPWTPVFLAAIYIFHPMLGGLALVGGAILIASTLINQVMTRKKTLEAARMNAQAARFANQVEDGGEVVWAQGMGRAMADRWATIRNGALAQNIHSADWTGSFASFSRAFRFFLQSAMLAVGAWLVLQNQITGGAMIAASILLGRALAPIEQGLAQWPVFQRATAGWRSLSETLSTPLGEDPATELPPPAANIAATQITMIPHPGADPVLNGVSLSVAPGQALGVIGKSGSGKSTLARVLVGLIRPNAGEVRIGGATLDQYSATRLGKFVGYLPQSVQLFDGTVSENIAHMALDPDPAQVIAAAKKARVHDIILKLPNGYDTPIGPANAALSGGQLQRVALARALYGDPVALILDEPNSALDAEGSEALNAAITQMKADGKAVIIMTHRPTAISACDNLVVLDNGKVVAAGERDEVIRAIMKNAGDVQRVVDPKANKKAAS